MSDSPATETAFDTSGGPEAVNRHAFAGDDLATIRDIVRVAADAAGMPPDDRDTLLIVVSEIATNAVVHGGGTGILAIHQLIDELMIEVRDSGPGLPDNLVIERPPPTATSGRGLWMARLLAARVDIMSGSPGLTVRIWAPRRATAVLRA